MIRLILSFGLICFAGYGFLARSKMGLPLLVYALSGVGLYFVWFPEQTTRIAHLVGVGRGADLLFYCWLLASLIVMFNLHVKANEQLRMITDLARALALATAQGHFPADDAGAEKKMGKSEDSARL